MAVNRVEKTAVQEIPLVQVLPFDAVIRDVIYDYIPYIKSVEAPVIDTWVLQRLRYLYQLQLAHLVYPSATHTRFSHSLGVMHVAYRFMSQIITRIEGVKNRIPREPVKLILNHPKEVLLASRIAGLLHDIGHGPFSHSFDKYVLKNKEYLGYIIGNHEILGYIIYRDYLRDHIARVLKDKTGINHEIVLDLLDEAMKPPRGTQGKTDLEKKGILSISDYYIPHPDRQVHRLVRMVVRDYLYPADIIDYLIRDSYFTKTPIGIINVEWLIIQTHVISHEGLVHPAISSKAIDDLVRMLNARRFMYKNVYLHPVNTAFDETIGILLNCDGIKQFIAEVLDKMLSGELHYYKALTDYSIYGILQRWSIENDLSKYCTENTDDARRALKSLFEYRKPLWKKIERLEFDREELSHLFSGDLGTAFLEIVINKMKKEIEEELGGKIGASDLKLIPQTITPYPSAAKEITEFIFIATTRGERAIGFTVKRLDEFVKEHGIRGEAMFTIYVDREKYRSLTDEEIGRIVDIVSRNLNEAAGKIQKSRSLPETS